MRRPGVVPRGRAPRRAEQRAIPEATVIYQVGGVVWLVFLVLAIPYVARARHPAATPLAAYLVFVGVLSLTAAALFWVLTAAVALLGFGAELATPLGAALFLLAVFAPAFAVARWQLRRNPGRSAGIPK
jgi:hypothetical protein